MAAPTLPGPDLLAFPVHTLTLGFLTERLSLAEAELDAALLVGDLEWARRARADVRFLRRIEPRLAKAKRWDGMVREKSADPARVA